MKKSSNLGLLLLVLAVILFIAVIIPQAKVFGGRSLTVKTTKAEVDSYNQRISDLDTLRSQGSSFQTVINELYQAMPSDTQIPEALVTIQDLGDNNGISFTGVSVGGASTPTDTTTSSSVATLPVTVSFNGDLSNVQGFLTALYNNLRTIEVLSQTIDSDQSGNLTVTMELGLVYQGGNSQ